MSREALVRLITLSVHIHKLIQPHHDLAVIRERSA